jgi:hypothetical protein
MKKRDWSEWRMRAGVRAAKTMAQAAIAGIGTAASMGDINFKYVISASVVAGVLSVLTSVAGLPEVTTTESSKGE